MKKILIALLALVACSSLCAQVLVDFGPGHNLVWNYNPKNKSAIVWLSYGIGRFAYVTKHRREYPKDGVGELSSRFGDELKGRETALDTYVNFRREEKCEKDEFWEDVRKVSDAGFLAEYVWTFYRHDAWSPKTEPKKLKEFDRWRAAQIPNHKTETHGKIEFKKKG